MRKRIFIAINLPEKIKKELEKFQIRFSELPARWVKPENLHITLAFLGYVRDEDLPKVIETTKEVALRHSPFSINLVKVCYAPPKVKPPRMVWVIGERNQELGNLQNDLQDSLTRINIPQLKEERERTFIPHITLARIRKWEFRQMEPDERPWINQEINLSFEVNLIEIMESHLKRSGAEYEILESVPLKKERRIFSS
jgi:2'-5' RNA ligase